jgi:hypothetical protein
LVTDCTQREARICPSSARQHPHSGRAPRKQTTHRLVGLDGDYTIESADEKARQLPGPGTEVKHGRRSGQSTEVQNVNRPSRTAALVLLMAMAGRGTGIDIEEDRLQI